MRESRGTDVAAQEALRVEGLHLAGTPVASRRICAQRCGFVIMSIDLDRRVAVAIMTFNNPQRLNAMTPAMRQQMEHRVIEVRDDPAIRALVITGAGTAFCAADDITTFATATATATATAVAMRDRLKQQHRVTLSMYRQENPVVAAVNGAAFGVGFSIAMVADIILAADTARFCQSYSNLGLVPDGGALYLLADVLKAQEARQLGIVREVYPAEQLMAEAMTLAERLAAGPTPAFGLDKAMLNRSWAPWTWRAFWNSKLWGIPT